MDFQLKEPEPGIFEIVQSVPQVVGIFEDRSIAEKVLGFLEMDALNAARITETPAEERAPATTKAKQQSDVPHFDWTEDELERAFMRLNEGEKVKEVAEHFDKSWSVLRSKWAAHSKRAKPDTDKAAAPAEPPLPASLKAVTAAIEELQGQTTCALCERPFTPSVESLEHCARCSQTT